MSRTGILFSAIALTLAVAACSPTGDGGGDDTDAAMDSGIDASVDASVDAGACVGAACCPDGGCPTGRACSKGACVTPGAADLGQACTTDAQCSAGICLRLDGGASVCSAPCLTAANCVSGWSCAATPGAVCQCSPGNEVCNGRDDDCNGVVDDEPLVTSFCHGSAGPYAVCEQGACACHFQMCSGFCVGLSDDIQDCGACGNACPTGATCNGGICQCPQGLTPCRGACTDTSDDVMNCGYCNDACPANEGCTGGRCACPFRATWCDIVDGGMDGGLDGGACSFLDIDVDNCGACNHACGSSGIPICVHGVCENIQSLGQGASQIVADTNHLYFANQPAIDRMDLDGGMMVSLASEGTTSGSESRGIATDGTNVYWISGQAVMSVPIGGGSAISLAAPLTVPVGITAQGGYVYWAEQGTTGTSVYPEDGAIVRAAIGVAGGGATTIASGQNLPVAITSDSTDVYWANAGAAWYTGAILVKPLAGGAAVTLADALTYPNAIALNETTVFWGTRIPLSGVPSQVMSIGKSQSGAVQRATDGESIYALAADATNVYWTDRSSVFVAPLNAFDQLESVGGTFDDPTCLAVSGTSVFWCGVSIMASPVPAPF